LIIIIDGEESILEEREERNGHIQYLESLGLLSVKVIKTFPISE